MKKIVRKKEVTNNELAKSIDHLAIMVAKGFESVHQDISSLQTDVSFLKKEVSRLDDNIVSTRKDISNLGERFVSKYQFDDLAQRVTLLEQKPKSKQGK